MTTTLRRTLTDEEKSVILNRYGKKCYATGHPIPDGEIVEFDHIHADSRGGSTDLNNIAPMCQKHNRQKSAFSLEDFRVKLLLRNFFDSGPYLTLGHLLRDFEREGHIPCYGQPVTISSENGEVAISAPDRNYRTPAYKCPTTGWDYCYATLPVDLIDSDDDNDRHAGLQPRYLIMDKVFGLYRHFQRHPVLQPAIGRTIGNRIKIFDGQHKIAALLWNNRRDFECKIYFGDFEPRLLNATNIAAHDAYTQTRFYSSIMILKLGNQFGKDFEDYKNSDTQPKSEVGFMKYLSELDKYPTRGDLNKKFRSYLYSSVLEDTDNKLKKLVSKTNRSSKEFPITMDMLHKSLFSCFLFREPSNDDMATEGYKRSEEIQNMVRMMNQFWDLGLSGWNTEIRNDNDNQRKLNRILASKSMMAWSELLRDSICAKIKIHDAEEKTRLFYRSLDNEQWNEIRFVLERLMNWSRWRAPERDEIDTFIAGNKSEVKKWFKEKGLTTGYLMGSPE